VLKNTQTKILLITKVIQSEILGSKFLPEKMQELHQLIKKSGCGFIYYQQILTLTILLLSILRTKLLSTDVLKLHQNFLGGYP
jgi:hypothetical protein